jgi:hypothetical protein
MMRARSLIAAMSLSAGGAAVLSFIAPWLNPCIGASRFADCIDPNSPHADSQGLIVVPADSWCYLGVCDDFLSATDIVIRICVVTLVLLAAGILSARVVERRRIIYGIVTALATTVLASALTSYLYPFSVR